MSPEQLALLVPIIAIFAAVAVTAIAVFARHRERLQRADLRHRERLAAIEKGIDLPPDPPEQTERVGDESRFLRQGLVLLLVGIAVTVALQGMPGQEANYRFGLIPVAVGVGYLVYYAIRGRKAARPPVAGPGAQP